MERDHLITGNVGLYWVCYRLSQLGWNAIPTSRNTRGVDLIVYNRNCTRMVGIQVKTLSNKNPVPLGTSLDKIMGDIWIIVNNVFSRPESYILLPEEVKGGAHRGEKNGKISYWLQPPIYCKDQFHEAWHRIDEKLNIRNNDNIH